VSSLIAVYYTSRAFSQWPYNASAGMRIEILAALLAAVPAAGQTILTEVVGESEFTFQRLAKRARAKLLEAASEPLVRYTMFASEPSPLFLTQSPVESFAGWLASWKSAAKVRWRVAEAVAIGPDAVLRIRMGRSMSRIVLRGRDPLFVAAGGRRCEILHVASRAPGSAAVYLRGPGPLPCEAVYRSLRQSIPLKLSVRMRTDPWFLNDPDFPPYCFFQISEPPTRDAVAAGVQTSCGQ
jgi:hypothetical protein